MQKSSYAIAQFSENFSQTTTIFDVISLIQANPNVDLAVDIVSKGIHFDFRSDTFVNAHAMILPKLHIDGVCYQTQGWQDIALPRGFSGLEAAFLKALHEAVLALNETNHMS